MSRRPPHVHWVLAEPERAKECEQAFQAGGPRTYIYDDQGRIRWSYHSAALSVRLASPGEAVYSRRKVTLTARYEWVRYNPAPTA